MPDDANQLENETSSEHPTQEIVPEPSLTQNNQQPANNSPSVISPVSNSEPVPTAFEATSSQAAKPQVNTPIALVLQWLTYALWGWTLIPLSFLVFSVVNSMLKPDADDFGSSFAIASIIVLLPLAFVCDIFYRKHEPQHKKGAAMVIMVIHAVIFILIAIGFLIAAVMSLVTTVSGEGSSSESTFATVISSVLVALLFAITVFRTFNPAQLPWVRRFFPIFMAVVVGIAAVAGFLGPIRNKVVQKNDTLIENNINSLNTSIQDYAYTNKKLPDNLNELKINGDAKILVDKQLVTYTPTTESSASNSSSRINNDASFDYDQYRSFKYKLCATYTHADSSERYSSYGGDSLSYVDTTGHKSGQVCYDLETDTPIE